MNFFKRIYKWFNHLGGSNTGDIVTWKDEGKVFFGFRCHCCGELDKKTVSIYKLDDFELGLNDIKEEDDGK